MSCFQVEAAEDIGWIVAPDESMFLVVDELGDGVVTLLSGVLAEIGEVDKLVAINLLTPLGVPSQINPSLS